MRRAVMVLVAVMLAGTAPAARAAVQTLGQSFGAPSALMDAAGTLHVVWQTPSQPAASDTVTYCRVASGPPACGQIGGFPSVLGNVFLRRHGDVLWLIANGLDDAADNVTFALSSSDGGTTWSAPAIVGRGLFEIDQVALTPDGRAADTIREGAGLLDWQRVPLTGGTETRHIRLGAGSRYSDQAQLLYPGGRTLVLANGVGTSRYRGLRAGAAPYLRASWTAWSASQGLPGINVDAAQGPRGIFALTHQRLALRIWRFNGRRFVRLSRHNVIGRQPVFQGDRALAQDPRGLLHAAWAAPCRGNRYCLYYRRAAHRSFSRTKVVRLRRGGEVPHDLSIAINASGRGWLVWHDPGTYSPVRIARTP